ncbi:hypothetical protein F511_31619 [Dorcoceras hygrometricum]|uniref:Secreted protein n=1 Tax=Dorcoceras hygrometricum TaxID=472368 RepID=A0A2Z7C137_9LAMI|nr:hypothetical protein F511_31619 [Dorcoceras hygrometricum]
MVELPLLLLLAAKVVPTGSGLGGIRTGSRSVPVPRQKTRNRNNPLPNSIVDEPVPNWFQPHASGRRCWNIPIMIANKSNSLFLFVSGFKFIEVGNIAKITNFSRMVVELPPLLLLAATGKFFLKFVASLHLRHRRIILQKIYQCMG